MNPIVKEIEKAERERMEQELKHRISYERENLTKELEVQNSRAKLEKLYETREQIERQKHDVERIYKSIEIMVQEQRHVIRDVFDRLDNNINHHLNTAIELMQKYIEQRMNQEKEMMEIITTIVKSANQANTADAKSRAAD